MARTLRIAPSILSADYLRLGEQLREAEEAGADAISLDVMDGHFVPVITFGADVIRAVRGGTSLPLEAHLMVANPEAHVAGLIDAGVETIIVHVETASHLHKVVDDIRRAGGRPGVTLNPGTPLVTLEPVLGAVDQVQIMSVNPGWGGQRFIPEALGRIRETRRMLDAIGSAAVLEVDGGVNAETIGEVAAAGADLVVAGSAVFNARESVGDAMARLRKAAGGGGGKS